MPNDRSFKILWDKRQRIHTRIAIYSKNATFSNPYDKRMWHFCRFLPLPIIPQPVRLLESTHYSSLHIGGTVEDFTAYLNIGQNAVVAIILECSSAHFQDVGNLLVGKQFIVERTRLSALK